jgi:hypothetical protein
MMMIPYGNSPVFIDLTHLSKVDSALQTGIITDTSSVLTFIQSSMQILAAPQALLFVSWFASTKPTD